MVCACVCACLHGYFAVVRNAAPVPCLFLAPCRNARACHVLLFIWWLRRSGEISLHREMKAESSRKRGFEKYNGFVEVYFREEETF